MEIVILACLIVLNGAFAMSEVALLLARRPRLESLAKQGDTLAAAAMKFSAEPTRFLSTIQIGITCIGLLNGILGEAIFAGPLTTWLRSLGMEQKASGVVATTVVVIAVTYASIVVGELIPKRLAQINAEGVARFVAWPMRLLAVISAPFVHLLSASTELILSPLLRLLRFRVYDSGVQPLSPEEIRTLVVESSAFMPKKHTSILLNLLDLGNISVRDIMVPRAKIESLRLGDDMEAIVGQLATSYHMRLPAFRDSLDEVIGVLHLRKILGPLRTGELSRDALEALLAEPYFVPASTPVLTQLQYFQEHRERIALVVDEYGDLMGLLTLEDIIEEIIGKFTTSFPSPTQALAWDAAGHAMADGTMTVRDVNRALGLNLPTEGPKTLNGLILEHLRDIPEADVSIRIGDVALEIAHTQGRTVKSVRLVRPHAAAAHDRAS